MQRNSPRFLRWSVGTDLALQCGLLLAVLLFGTELLPVVHGQMNKEEAADNAESEYPRAPPHGNEPSGLTGNVGHPQSRRNSAYLPVPLSHTEMPDLHHPSPTGSSENPTQLQLLQQKLLDRQVEVNRLNAFIFSLEQMNQALINNMAALQQLYDAEREDSTPDAKLTIYSQRIDSLESEAALKDEQIRKLSTMLEEFAKTDQSSTNTQLFSLIDVVIDHNSKLKHDYNACIKGNIGLQLERNQRRLEDWNSRIEILRQHTSFSNEVMELLQTFVRTAQSSSLKELLPQIQLQNTNIIHHMNRLDAEIGRSKNESDAHLMDLLAAQEELRLINAAKMKRSDASAELGAESTRSSNSMALSTPSDCDAKLAASESELEQARSECAVLRLVIRTQEEEIKAIQKKSRHAESGTFTPGDADCDARINELEEKYESQLQELELKTVLLHSEKSDLTKALQEKDDELARLAKEVENEKVGAANISLNHELRLAKLRQEHQSTLQTLNTTLIQLKSEKAQYEDAVRERDDELARLAKEVENEKAGAARIHTDHDSQLAKLRQEHQSTLQALNTTLIQLKSEKAQYEDAVREKDDELARLAKEVENEKAGAANISLNHDSQLEKLRQEHQSRLQALNTTLIQLKSEKAQYEDAVRERDDALRELNTKWAAEKVEYDALRKAQQAGHDVGSPDVAELKSARRAQNYVLVGIVVGLVLPLAAAVAVLVYVFCKQRQSRIEPSTSDNRSLVEGDETLVDLFAVPESNFLL